MDWLINLDGNILLWIQDNIRNGILTPFMKIITHFGDAGIFWIALTVVLLFFKKTRKIGIMCAVSLILSVVINNVIIKNLVARTRPYEVVEGLKLLIAKQSDFSFPSGHTGASFAAAVVIFMKTPKKYGIPAMIMAALIAFSRLYVGVHYPTDVLAGLVTGTICALMSVKLSLWRQE